MHLSVLRRALVVLAPVLLAIGCNRAERPAQPNVVLVSIDSLRADHVGVLGYARDTTPAIDRLAENAAVFTHAISTSSWTLPAHAALLTGLGDSAHGVLTPKDRLGDEATTLAAHLRRSGYETVGFYSGPFLDPAFGLARGFDRYIDCTSYRDSVAAMRVAERHAASHADRTNETVREAVLAELGRVSDRPFFFFIHLWDVHYDLIPPPPYDRMFDPSYAGSFDGARYRHNPAFRVGMSPADLAHTIALYDGEVRYTDDTLGSILAELDRRGLRSSTIVVITADHGDEFLDHGGKGHRHTLYDELIRIPLVVAWPGTISAARVEAVVSIVDVAPTILDLLELPAVPAMTGRSLVPLVRGDRSLEAVPALAELRAPPRAPELRAIVLGSDKVVVDPRTSPPARYYDLESDPREHRPQDATSVEVGRRLLATLDRLPDGSNGTTPKPDAATLPEPVERSLAELGYLDE